MRYYVGLIYNLCEDYPECEVCGAPISYENMKFKMFSNHKRFDIEVPKCMEVKYRDKVFKNL